MWLKIIIKYLSYVAEPSAKYTNIIAASILFIMMALTGVDVIGRYLFNKPISGSMELTEFMMASLVALGLAYCAMRKEHVRVDLFITKLAYKVQALLNSLASLVFFSCYGIIAWQSVYRAVGMMDSNLTSTVLFIPKAPFVFVVTAGSIALCLILLRDFFEYLFQVAQK